MPNYISSSPIIKNPLYSTRNKLENNLIYDYKDQLRMKNKQKQANIELNTTLTTD